MGTTERWVSGLVLLAAAGVFTVLAVRHPAGLMPACPTAAYLGFYCPGCGSLRASHHLLNGRPGAGWRHNPLLVVIGVPLGLWFAVALFMAAAFGRRLRPLLRSPVWAWGALALLLVYTAVRNLPGRAFEPLRPPAISQSQGDPTP